MSEKPTRPRASRGTVKSAHRQNERGESHHDTNRASDNESGAHDVERDEGRDPAAGFAEPLAAFFDYGGEVMRESFAFWNSLGQSVGQGDGQRGKARADERESAAGGFGGDVFDASQFDPEALADWAHNAQQIQKLWLDFLARQAQRATGQSGKDAPLPFDPAKWLVIAEALARALPKDIAENLTHQLERPLEMLAKAPQDRFGSATPEAMFETMGGIIEAGSALAQDSLKLWQATLSQIAQPDRPIEADALPARDRRFAHEAWRRHPAYLLLHQAYLMLSAYFLRVVREARGLDKAQAEALEFAVRALVEALSPANFLITNPQVLERTIEERGRNLARGLEHLIADLERGQLTHSDPNAFKLGENLAATPGKVVYETALFQLIQYSPTTDKVLETPLVIFPPWINRFYILDLTPEKSFVKWALDQGLSVFMVSWKSADASMKDVVWDDYIAAQIEAIDVVRERLKVKSVHAIGYCVAGTTLAATLAVLARRGEADKVKSATFFTAQVDFERAGELKNFISDTQLAAIEALSSEGYLDGRYLAATFNALRAKDLIWNYVVNNYLLGEDYPAFDLLHWNGDVTNLPAKWHQAYLRDLYRDNKLVVPDALSALGTPIDLRRIETPAYVQAGREDHIAPPESVWKITHHLKGPVTFVLAGSGHIAGVVNPPQLNKYQYWTCEEKVDTLDEFIAKAQEHKGSWWPHWIAWIRAHGDKLVPATGKRKPGGRGDKVIEDAPGRYVKMR